MGGPGRQIWVARQFGQPNAHTIAETLVNLSFNQRRRMRSACLGTGMIAVVMLVGSASAQPLTIGLKAVQRNGIRFEPTGRLVVDPGDTIQVEIYASGWADALPAGVRSFTAMIQGVQAATSGPNGTVLPVGWDAPLQTKACNSDADCTILETCDGFCHGPKHSPSAGAFIDGIRTDFIFAELGPIVGTGTRSLNYVFFGVAPFGEEAPDRGFPAYLGTVILTVSEYACGKFVLRLDCHDTFLVSTESVPAEAVLDALVLDVGDCPLLPQSSRPTECSVDARIPHASSVVSSVLGWDSVDIDFDGDPADLVPLDFAIDVVPPDGSLEIVDLSLVAEKQLRVTLSSVIPLERWSCVRHIASGRSACFGNLPGDVDNRLTTGWEDLVTLVEALKARIGPKPVEAFRYDIDRSGRFTPIDLFAMINLLSGVGFDSWSGATIPIPCPLGSTFARRGSQAASRGSCCHLLTGTCEDGVLHEDCVAEDEVWAGLTPCCSITCESSRGACCDTNVGNCQDNVTRFDCRFELGEIWYEGLSCDSIVCPCLSDGCDPG